ncbi:hypothetical protein IAD21_02957 [Abditibacteriota bacterium]|nr:hypothetical protein IAD21_02957 [Abditibacteriota bacterium]
MNRRLFLVGAALSTPLGLGWWAKSVASWRPVTVGKVGTQKDEQQLVISPQQVLFTRGEFPWRINSIQEHCTLFDLKSGLGQPIHLSKPCIIDVKDDNSWCFHVGLDGDRFWYLCWDAGTRTGHVEVENGENGNIAKRFSFDLPNLKDNQLVTLRNAAREDRELFLCQSHIYSWDAQNARLKQTVKFEDSVGAILSRDTHTFIAYDLHGFKIGDARSGKIEKRIPFQNFYFFRSLCFSPYGQYALCERPTSPSSLRVVRVATGKPLWSFDVAIDTPPWNFSNDINNSANWLVTDDEQSILVRRDKDWEVRDLGTGDLLYCLPLVPSTSVTALSPDGTTLYSVAGGILYRQRAR